VGKADFQKSFSGFAVESKLARAVDLNKRYRISSTPTVIVNGRYITDVGMAGGEEQLFQLINTLAAREKPAG
jgi:thiol:disulfide interchange protein DsbA